MPERQSPQLAMSLAGSDVDPEMAPLNHTYQPPMHYMVRVCVLLWFGLVLFHSVK